ncbi:MAG: response regulator transcription factor [Provencibacterium sp.]|jgi:two-component system response regulator ResD|nr:response regulator transcription factor [Provencibacterium sp.]
MDNRILIAEDESKIRRLVAGYLTKEGFRVIEAADGAEALERFEEAENVALVILDVMMPRMDGYEACRRIRALSPVPILMLTARDAENDEIDGFDAGADEYIAKPFSPAILVARVKNLLRRTSVGGLNDITLGSLEIRCRERTVQVNGRRVFMTPREFDLLYYLACNRNVALTRSQMISTVWDMDYMGDDRTVDTHIKCLRAKLGEYAHCIVTLRKVGYKFEWPV